MLGFSNLHVLTISHGEVYVHHFWMLFWILYFIFSAAKAYHSSGK